MVADTTNLPLFLLSVFAISLTGAMMPGPVTAVAIANGYKRKGAGALIAVGHGLIEIPLILMIYFGLASILDSTGVRIGVGLVGGLVLIWMGLNMFRSRSSIFSEQREQAHNSVIAGLAVYLQRAEGTGPQFCNRRAGFDCRQSLFLRMVGDRWSSPHRERA